MSKDTGWRSGDKVIHSPTKRLGSVLGNSREGVLFLVVKFKDKEEAVHKDPLRRAYMEDGKAITMLSEDEQNHFGQRLLALTPSGSEFFKPLSAVFQVDMEAVVSFLERKRHIAGEAFMLVRELKREYLPAMKALQPGLKRKVISYGNAWEPGSEDKITIQEVMNWRSAVKCGAGQPFKYPNESQERHSLGYIDWLIKRVSDLEVGVVMSAKKFREYEQLHLSKPNGEGWEKAKANAQFAEALEELVVKEVVDA